MDQVEIIQVDQSNVQTYGIACVSNPKNSGYKAKLKWIKDRFPEGLTMLHLRKKDKTIGFIEYVPGDLFWRPVDADGYMMIHCIWIHQKDNQGKGYGSRLLNECIKDAQNRKLNGVGVVTSDGPWMADKRLFLQNGFEMIDRSERFELLVKKFNKGGALPKFKEWAGKREKYQGLNLTYSHQCPYMAKCVEAPYEEARDQNLPLKIIELKNAKEAQNAPSGYGIMNLTNNGKLLADHYISRKRFQNIIKKTLITGITNA